jgi:hypothetical protein
MLAFQGSRTGRSAFALVNARWSAGLAASGEYEIVDYDPRSPAAPDLLIHHDFESHFLGSNRPPARPRWRSGRGLGPAARGPGR